MDEKSIALGTFDGLHIGHLEVIKQAKASKYEPYVLLFDVHPLSLITGKAPATLLLDKKREEIISSLGAKTITVSFKEISNYEPEDFVNKILIEKYNAKSLACGENYTFGKGGKGNVDLLKKLCMEKGIELHIAKTQNYKNETISSTKIRSLLEKGKIEDVNNMLSRHFSYCLEVVNGDKRGRELGFPTINQFFPDNFIKLKFGVYASRTIIDGKYYPSVTNIGIRPTVGSDKYRSETHIIGIDKNLYSQFVEVELVKFLRPEQKFSSLEELSRTIENDSKNSIDLYNITLAKDN